MNMKNQNNNMIPQFVTPPSVADRDDTLRPIDNQVFMSSYHFNHDLQYRKHVIGNFIGLKDTNMVNIKYHFGYKVDPTDTNLSNEEKNLIDYLYNNDLVCIEVTNKGKAENL